MLLTINLGLAIGNGAVGAGEAAHELETLGQIVGLNLKHDMCSESTLVADLVVMGKDIVAIRQRAASISAQLRQDHIAVWFHAGRNDAEIGHGELIGEKSSHGEFNPIRFHFIGAHQS